MANQTFSIRETKFTPGPWKAQLNAPLAAVPGHLVKTDDNVERPIALLWEGGGTHGKPTQIANAHLIAAAPELYEALDTVRHQLLISGKTEGDQLLDLVTSVMRKVRGEK